MNHKIQNRLSVSAMLAIVFGMALFGVSHVFAKCDLKAEFIAPTGITLTGSQSVTWTIRFTNIAQKGQCAANTIALHRYSGNTASGYGTAIGGSGNLKKLPALNPGESVDLSFAENAPPNTGTFTYKLRYSSRHNDTDNINHHPTKTVTYQAPLAPTGPSDLVVENVAFTLGPQVGNCNKVQIVVKNLGSMANVISRATVIVFPTGNPFQNRSESHVFFSSFLA